MRVCPKHDKGVDRHLVEVLGLADDAQDDVSQLGRRFEEQPALQGASGDFDEGICGNETERPWHAWLSAIARSSCGVSGLKKPLAQPTGGHNPRGLAPVLFRLSCPALVGAPHVG
jgi:hypothetical protein